MTVIEFIKDKLMLANKEYADKAPDHFDYWEQHIQLVVKEALILADTYGADKEIVELGALLHDIASISEIGTRADHHINGKIIADKLLSEYGYPNDRKERVLGCILHHRSSKYAENIEEWIRYFEHDYNDLSEQTKVNFKPRYDVIMDVLFGALL